MHRAFDNLTKGKPNNQLQHTLLILLRNVLRISTKNIGLLLAIILWSILIYKKQSMFEVYAPMGWDSPLYVGYARQILRDGPLAFVAQRGEFNLFSQIAALLSLVTGDPITSVILLMHLNGILFIVVIYVLVLSATDRQWANGIVIMAPFNAIMPYVLPPQFLAFNFMLVYLILFHRYLLRNEYERKERRMAIITCGIIVLIELTHSFWTTGLFLLLLTLIILNTKNTKLLKELLFISPIASLFIFMSQWVGIYGKVTRFVGSERVFTDFFPSKPELNYIGSILLHYPGQDNIFILALWLFGAFLLTFYAIKWRKSNRALSLLFIFYCTLWITSFSLIVFLGYLLGDSRWYQFTQRILELMPNFVLIFLCLYFLRHNTRAPQIEIQVKKNLKLKANALFLSAILILSFGSIGFISNIIQSYNSYATIYLSPKAYEELRFASFQVQNPERSVLIVHDPSNPHAFFSNLYYFSMFFGVRNGVYGLFPYIVMDKDTPKDPSSFEGALINFTKEYRPLPSDSVLIIIDSFYKPIDEPIRNFHNGNGVYVVDLTDLRKEYNYIWSHSLNITTSYFFEMRELSGKYEHLIEDGVLTAHIIIPNSETALLWLKIPNEIRFHRDAYLALDVWLSGSVKEFQTYLMDSSWNGYSWSYKNLRHQNTLFMPLNNPDAKWGAVDLDNIILIGLIIKGSPGSLLTLKVFDVYELQLLPGK